jgi:hypothetical protein
MYTLPLKSIGQNEERRPSMMQYMGAFFSAVLLFNTIPHLVQGICGKRHMSPFSTKSHPVTNVIWGWINLVAGVWLGRACHWESWDVSLWITFSGGGLLVSVYLAAFWSNPEARLPWHKA